MAKQVINIGTTPGDGTGDPARVAFDKANDNFTELYDGLDAKLDDSQASAFGLTLLDDVDAATARTTLGLGTLATQSGTFSGTSSGTNTGDQTSIVGITGTKAQFDTAVTDGNFLYVGDAPTAHSHGNIANDGTIGSTANLPIITGTAGIMQAGSFGTGANTFCQGNDSRLSDDRTANGLRTASGIVSISGAAAPAVGQSLVATSSTTATWQTPSGGGGVTQEATYTMTSTGVTVPAGGVALVMDVFNASGSGVALRIIEVLAWQRNSAAVSGVRVPVEMRRTTAVGTGGTSISPGVRDTADAALPAQVTARTGPTGGATGSGGFLGGGRVLTEEAAAGTSTTGMAPWFQSESTIYVNEGLTQRKRLVLRENEGMRVDVGVAVSGAGLVAAQAIFHVGSVGSAEQPTFSWQANSAATGNKNMIDVFNASGSNKVLTITRIAAYARPTALITGTVITLEASRTTAVGTGGSTITGDSYDTSDAALPAQITARDAPTGGATISGSPLIVGTLGTDETSDSEFRASGKAHNTQYVWNSDTKRRPITLRQGEGMVLRTGPLSGVGNVVTIIEGFLTDA